MDDYSAIAFDCSDYYPPQATVSLAETNLLIPNSPSSIESVKDEEDKKPTRKRKSWGQELPTPKTNLPPRKRAKTEDEKEQRRIERVLRNRQAAQSSRERKRLEVEKLEGEKQAIEHQNQILRERLMAVEHEKFKLGQKLAKMKAEMSYLKKNAHKRRIDSVISSVASSPSPRISLPHEGQIKQELDDYTFALPTPRYSTATSSSSFSTPGSSPYPRSPSPLGLDLNSISSSSDLTQHPAAMLCGLQCQSEAAWLIPARPTTLDEVQRRVHLMILCQLLYLTLTSAICSHILNPLHMIMISLPTNSPPLNTTLSTKTTPISLLIKWLISKPAKLSLPTTTISPFRTPSPTTITSTTSARTPSTNSLALPVSKPTLSISLLRHLLVCSPALARPLKGATGRAMRPKNSTTLKGNSSDGVPKLECREMEIDVGGGDKEGDPGEKDVVSLPVTDHVRKKRRRSDRPNCISRSKRRKLARGV